MNDASDPRTYSIVVRGRLGCRLDGMFGDLKIRAGAGETELLGPIVDQAELYGLLTCLRDLGIDLVSVNPVRDPTAGDRDQ